MLNMLKALWSYRGFVISSIRNEFISRFGRSKLGGLWMIIHPLAQVAIFALVLSNVLAAKLPGIENTNAYALYLMAGTLAWSLFVELINRCLTLFIEQGGVMKKMYFPRITLPAIVVGSSLLNHLLLFVSIIAIFSLLGKNPDWTALWILPLTVIVIALALGVGLILGVLNVFVRDVGQVVPVILQLLFWLTPIVYPASIIPENFKDFLNYNPLYPLVSAYQKVLVYNTPPDLEPMGVLSAVATGILLLGLFIFRRASPELVDVL
jgi:lipopolysaccharide transport system permease protein